MTDAHNSPAIEPRYLKQVDAARYLSVSVRTLHRWKSDGTLLPHDIAGVDRYAVADLEALADRKTA